MFSGLRAETLYQFQSLRKVGTGLGTGGILTTRGSSIDLKLGNRPSATRELRAAVDRVADEWRLDDSARFDLKVAATEALTNALRDAPEDHVVDVTVAADQDSVDIEVADRGVFLPFGAALHRGPDAEGGRGIPLMIALVDEVEFARTGGGTRVRIRKRVAPAGEGSSVLGNNDAAAA